jgi:hypothetical protein
MAKSYKQRIYADLNRILYLYPNAKVSDVIWALDAMADSLWKALPPSKKGRKTVEKVPRYRVV